MERGCRNWGKQDLVKDVKFTTNVTLLDNVAVVKFIMTYTGTITHVSPGSGMLCACQMCMQVRAAVTGSIAYSSTVTITMIAASQDSI